MIRPVGINEDPNDPMFKLIGILSAVILFIICLIISFVK